jgi:hypothetical protein
MNGKKYLWEKEFEYLYNKGKRDFSGYWMEVKYFCHNNEGLTSLPDLPNCEEIECWRNKLTFRKTESK